jgi:hypothetical protein
MRNYEYKELSIFTEVFGGNKVCSALEKIQSSEIMLKITRTRTCLEHYFLFFHLRAHLTGT